MKRALGTAEKPALNPTPDSEEKSGVRTTSVLGSTRLRFERGAVSCILTVEAPARDDLIHELYRLLFSSGVQVVRVHAQVLGDRTLHELDVVDADGHSLDEECWRKVQASICEHLGDRVAPFGPELRFTRGPARALRQAAE
jgi:UTP:GlnB (protein PII) uridylyltransferase